MERNKPKSVKFTANGSNATSGRTEPSQPNSNTTLWKERQLRDYRPANNLCYFCGNKFDGNQLQMCTKCHKPQLNALVINDLDAELTEETLNQLEVEDVLIAEMGQLSLNVLSGTESGDATRIRALVHNKVMLILVDSSSSHSFVSHSFLLNIGIQSCVAVPMNVTVTNGDTLVSDQQVSELEWLAQGYTFHTIMRVLDIGAYDAILGYCWGLVPQVSRVAGYGPKI
jgi:hypothetical protein